MKALLLASAKVGKTHGVDGFLRIYSLSGEYRHLKKLETCKVTTKDGRELSLVVDSVRVDGELFLMRQFSIFQGKMLRSLRRASII